MNKVQLLHISLLIVINSYKLLDGVREHSNWYNDDQPKNKKQHEFCFELSQIHLFLQ